jgi:mannose-6-phosphate isomerase-like protein (cupin superfamily)
MFDNNMMPYENSYYCPCAQGMQIYNPYCYPSSLWMFMPLCFYSHPIPKYDLKDYGPDPFVINIRQAAKQNENFRLALWTGKDLQVTLMSINIGDDIGLEVHPHLDQFLRVEQGQGLVLMGDHEDDLYYRKNVKEGYIIIVPAGKWHNILNTGCIPMKLYSIYAPPQHPYGTVQSIKPEENHKE